MRRWRRSWLTSVVLVAAFGGGCASRTGSASGHQVQGQRRSGDVAEQAAGAAVPAEPALPADLRRTTLRLRVLGIEPAASSEVSWRQGGEGLGGKPRRGVFTHAGHVGPIAIGEWTDPISLSDIVPDLAAHDGYITLTIGAAGRPSKKGVRSKVGHARNVQLELEHRDDEVLLRSFRTSSANGGTVTLVVPGSARDGFVQRLSTATELADERRKFLLALPWASWKLPTKTAFVTDLGGYGEGSGRGIRIADPAILQTELGSLQQLGINGLRAAPELALGLAQLSRARVLGPIGYPLELKGRARDNSDAGCAFADEVPELTAQMLERARTRAVSEQVEEVWVITRDEITPASSLSLEKASHLATCAACSAGFTSWLQKRGFRPTQVGASGWSDVRPIDQLDSSKPWLDSAALSLRAYLTRQFSNVSSASLFTPLRDAFRAYNVEQARKLYSFGLRGNTFLTNDNGLDFFEFYRHADNAMVWETSNRDARAWPWDSYLADVQRVLSRELGLAAGMYIKPHRGAPVQRLLTAVSRGNTLIYWYTFGPEYWKGDAFAAQPAALALASKASHLLGRAEDYVYGATYAVPPKVAIVKPDTSTSWLALGRDEAPHRAALENAKWIYTALQHAHVPVDPLDEGFLEQLDLARYDSVFVQGTHLRVSAARALERYVKGGGTLITSGGGLVKDEANQPLLALRGVLGLSRRNVPELWCNIETYGATQLAQLDGCGIKGRILPSEGLEQLSLAVGREPLEPVNGADVLARFDDGRVAIVLHRYGKGRAIVVGAYPGLEYAAPVLRPGFSMRRDFDVARRRYVEAFVDGVDRPVDCSDPLVEAVLLRSVAPQHLAVTLANWGYVDEAADAPLSGLAKHVKLDPVHDVRLLLKNVHGVRRIRSSALGRDLPFVDGPDGSSVVVPSLEEGDILMVDQGGAPALERAN